MYKYILERIQSAIEERFPIFKSAMEAVEDELSSMPEDKTGALPVEDDLPSVIPDFMQKLAELSVLKKVLIAPLAPVLLIGFVGRLPYVGYMHVVRFVGEK